MSMISHNDADSNTQQDIENKVTTTTCDKDDTSLSSRLVGTKKINAPSERLNDPEEINPVSPPTSSVSSSPSVGQSIVINTYQRDLAETAVIAAMNVLEAGGNMPTAQTAASAVLSVEADRCYGGLYYRGKQKRAMAATAAASSSVVIAVDAGINEEEATDIVQKVLASQGVFERPLAEQCGVFEGKCEIL
jgi:hypothetical protein